VREAIEVDSPRPEEDECCYPSRSERVKLDPTAGSCSSGKQTTKCLASGCLSRPVQNCVGLSISRARLDASEPGSFATPFRRLSFIFMAYCRSSSSSRYGPGELNDNWLNRIRHIYGIIVMEACNGCLTAGAQQTEVNSLASVSKCIKCSGTNQCESERFRRLRVIRFPISQGPMKNVGQSINLPCAFN
jgi:hypothetical protein